MAEPDSSADVVPLADKTSRLARVRGHVDVAEPTRIRGWAVDDGDPDAPVTIGIYEGEHLIAIVAADEDRPDLRQAGIGNGRHGFSLNLSRGVFPCAYHRISVRVHESQVDLKGSPCVLRGIEGSPGTEALAAGLASLLAASDTPDDIQRIFRAGLRLAADAAGRLRGSSPAGLAAELTGPLDRSEADAAQLLRSLVASYPALPALRHEAPVLSVITSSRNAFNACYRIFEALSRRPPPIPMEFVLVDVGSTDETMLAESILGRAAKVFRLDSGATPGRVLRAGLSLARGSYAAYVAPGTDVSGDALQRLVGCLEREPDLLAVSPSLLDDDVWRFGLNVTDAGELRRPLLPGGGGRGFGRVFHDADAVDPACFVVHRKRYLRTPGFSLKFGEPAYVIADLCMAGRSKGYRVAVAGAVTAVDRGSPPGLPKDTPVATGDFAPDRRAFYADWKAGLSTQGDWMSSDTPRLCRQPCIVFVDHRLPDPAVDAGSQASASHIQQLRTLGYAVVLVVPRPGEGGGDSEAAWRDQGVEIVFASGEEEVGAAFSRVSEAFGSVVAVVLHRFRIASRYLAAARSVLPGAGIVYSLADIHFLRLLRQAEATGDAETAARAAEIEPLEREAMAKADVVITHSAFEADYLRGSLPATPIHVVPWTVRTHAQVAGDTPRSGILFVGGREHAPNADAIDRLRKEIMPRLADLAPEIVLTIVGKGNEGLPDTAPNIRWAGWVEDLAPLYAKARFTVAPLRFGAGIKGKVIESFAAGVPCLMSPLAAEGIALPEALTPWVVSDGAAFATAIAERHAAAWPDDLPDICRGAVAAFTDEGVVRERLARAISDALPSSSLEKKRISA